MVDSHTMQEEVYMYHCNGAVSQLFCADTNVSLQSCADTNVSLQSYMWENYNYIGWKTMLREASKERRTVPQFLRNAHLYAYVLSSYM